MNTKTTLATIGFSALAILTVGCAPTSTHLKPQNTINDLGTSYIIVASPANDGTIRETDTPSGNVIVVTPKDNTISQQTVPLRAAIGTQAIRRKTDVLTVGQDETLTLSPDGPHRIPHHSYSRIPYLFQLDNHHSLAIANIGSTQGGYMSALLNIRENQRTTTSEFPKAVDAAGSCNKAIYAVTVDTATGDNRQLWRVKTSNSPTRPTTSRKLPDFPLDHSIAIPVVECENNQPLIMLAQPTGQNLLLRLSPDGEPIAVTPVTGPASHAVPSLRTIPEQSVIDGNWTFLDENGTLLEVSTNNGASRQIWTLPPTEDPYNSHLALTKNEAHILTSTMDSADYNIYALNLNNPNQVERLELPNLADTLNQDSLTITDFEPPTS